MANPRGSLALIECRLVEFELVAKRGETATKIRCVIDDGTAPALLKLRPYHVAQLFGCPFITFFMSLFGKHEGACEWHYGDALPPAFFALCNEANIHRRLQLRCIFNGMQVREKPRDDHTSTIYVTNLPREIDEDSVRKLFAEWNPVNVRMPVDQATQKPRGFAYIQFSTHEEAELALKMDNMRIDKRELTVVPSRPKQQVGGLEMPCFKLVSFSEVNCQLRAYELLEKLRK